MFCQFVIFVEVERALSFIVDFNKKVGRKVSIFLRAMNFNEILYKYLAILMIYKSILLWYNNTRRGTHGPISVSTNKRSITVTCLEAKCQSYGMNHAQSISCYAFLFYKFAQNV